jgi:hypothetical protein
MKAFVYLNRHENLSAAVDYSRSDDAIIAIMLPSFVQVLAGPAPLDGQIKATVGFGVPSSCTEVARYIGFERFALNGKFAVHGSSVWSLSEASIAPAPAATSEPSGNPRLVHHSAGISCRPSSASNAGPHHHAGAGDRSCSGTARHRANSCTMRSKDKSAV